MNQNTAKSLKDFISAIEILTAGVAHEIGLTTAGEILTACNELKRAINKDETIPK